MGKKANYDDSKFFEANLAGAIGLARNLAADPEIAKIGRQKLDEIKASAKELVSILNRQTSEAKPDSKQLKLL